VDAEGLRDARDQDFRQAAVACLDGLYGFALALSRDRETAEDLVQETYARALAARRRAAPEDNLRGWLFTILRNIWKNERRRRRPEGVDDIESTALAVPDSSNDPQAALDQRELRERLDDAMGALPAPFREVVMLRCVLGFSYQEVAGIVGCPAGTVMSRLARARAQLRRSLGPMNGSGPEAER
jgi:RNA polymerase sigma-70 factor (ECF subfamily)